MKKVLTGVLALTVSAGLLTTTMAGPADSAANGVQIKNSTLTNKSDVSNSRITNVGVDQKVNVGGVKIRKGTKMENTKLSNKSKVKNTAITNVGVGQDVTVGGVDIGDKTTTQTGGAALKRGNYHWADP